MIDLKKKALEVCTLVERDGMWTVGVERYLRDFYNDAIEESAEAVRIECDSGGCCECYHTIDKIRELKFDQEKK